jgi:hypothetical protein
MQAPYLYSTPLPATPRPAGSPWIGLIALVVAIVALTAGEFSTFSLVNTLANYDYTQGQQAFNAQIGRASVVMWVAALFGTGSLAASIVATVLNRGRVFGIIGIVVNVAAPILVWISFIAMAATIHR